MTCVLDRLGFSCRTCPVFEVEQLKAPMIRLCWLIGALLCQVPLSSPAAAWGQFGHVTICEIAYRALTDDARVKLNELLRVDSEYRSFNRSCLEEDEFPRPNPSHHFVNYARDLASVDGTGCPTEGECILSAIDDAVETLGDDHAPAEERADALLALGHWVGDIHQPLHVSYADDRGGNRIRKSGRCAADNLHAVWDNCLVEDRVFKARPVSPDLFWARFTRAYRAADALIEATTADEVAEWQGSEPWEWAAESYLIATSPDVEYCVWVGDECWYSETNRVFEQGVTTERVFVSTDAYLDLHEATAALRIRQAGYRLAHLLNLALDPE